MEESVSELRNRVRDDLSTYLSQGVKWRTELFKGVEALRGTEAFIFGGLIGEILRHRTRATPRDVDIVVADLPIAEIQKRFRFGANRINRFGGLAVTLGKWKFDVWPLDNTWAFKEGLVAAPYVSNLPRTTFLNIEAVAVELFPGAAGRRVFDGGCFEAWHKRCLDINLEENPDPSRAALRALFSAFKYDFQISPRLSSYIIKHTERAAPSDLTEMEIKHFGYRRFGGEELRRWTHSIAYQLAKHPDRPAKLPISRSEQIRLDL